MANTNIGAREIGTPPGDSSDPALSGTFDEAGILAAPFSVQDHGLTVTQAAIEAMAAAGEEISALHIRNEASRGHIEAFLGPHGGRRITRAALASWLEQRAIKRAMVRRTRSTAS